MDDVQWESATKKDFGDRAKRNRLRGLIAGYPFDTSRVSGCVGPWYEFCSALEDIKNHPKFYGGNPFGRFRDTVVLDDKGLDFIPDSFSLKK